VSVHQIKILPSKQKPALSILIKIHIPKNKQHTTLMLML